MNAQFKNLNKPTNHAMLRPVKNGVLQRSPAQGGLVDEVPPIVHEVINSSGHSLDTASRSSFEQRFGRDFSCVRVHTDARAAESARAVSALAYTVGQNIVFRDGQFRPGSTSGQKLLAHELAHVVQQDNSFAHVAPSTGPFLSRPDDPAEAAADRAADLVMSNGGQGASVAAMTPNSPATIHRTVDDPQRFRNVHQSMFVGSPTVGGSALQTWQDPGPGVVGTAATLFNQAKTNIQQHLQQNPFTPVPTRTTEADLDTDAVDINQQLRARFPFISVSVSSTQIRARVNVMTPTLTTDADYLRQWLANRLPRWSDVENFQISETDPRFVALLDRLLADTDVGPGIKEMASRQSGFQRGEGQTRDIFLHRGVDPQLRRRTLFHELTHFYAHPTYREWVATTTNERWYNEGFTEYLARLAMPAAMRAQATNYQDRVNSINTQVAAHVPDDDIARGFFLGEIWRIETRSTISRREAGAQLGLSATATAAQEKDASRTGPGINQTVVPGRRYRFMNIGFDQPSPKPEHVTFFRGVKSEHLDPAPALGVVFEGHASTAGPTQYNLNLSLRRAQAFYQMARNEGLTGNRLIDAGNPPHFGETRPTAEEEDPATRAFNRRVEMQVRPVV